MKALIRILSLTILINLLFAISCSKDEAKPAACNGSLTAIIDGKTNLTSCLLSDGSITASATGGVEPYKFSLNGGTKQATGVFNNLTAGTYTVSVFDANNCEDSETNIVITVPNTTLALTATPTSDTNCLGNNGSIVTEGTGGDNSSAYQYALNSGAFGVSGTFSNLAPGTYSVKVKDAGGCVISKSVNVLQGLTGVTYDADILPIFNAKCSFPNCHPANGDWFTYSTAKNNAATIKTKTGNGSMPKGGSSAPGGALSADQIALIACWVNDGAPQ